MRLTHVAVFMICVVAASAMLQGSGFYDSIGSASPDPGIDASVEKAQGSAPTDVATSLSDQVLGGISTFIMSTVSHLLGALAPALNVESAAENVGLPAWAATYMAAPISILMSLAIIYFLTGRRNP